MQSSTTSRHPGAASPRRPPAAPSPTPGRPFRNGVLAGAAAVLALVLLVALVVAVWPASPAEETHRLADKIRAQDAARNKKQVKALTTQARSLEAKLTPLLQRMERAMPHEKGTPHPAGASEAGRWKKVTSAAVASLADPPSGDTGYNIARADFAAAVRALDGAVDSYRLSHGAPSSLAKKLAGSAAAQRDQAIDLWSVGATALDEINLKAGYGHQHVFLHVTGGAGAMDSDGAPEGSEAK